MKNLFLCFMVLVFISPLSAQTKKVLIDSTPQFVVTLGGLNEGSILPDQLKKHVDSAIIVKDKKGNQYPLVRFRINYSFTNTYRDTETELMKKTKDFRAADFYDTAFLSQNWAESIKDNVKPGDELLFNWILVRLKNGKKIMVPDWKVTIK